MLIHRRPGPAPPPPRYVLKNIVNFQNIENKIKWLSQNRIINLIGGFNWNKRKLRNNQQKILNRLRLTRSQMMNIISRNLNKKHK
jgi:hypothetical protein